MDDPCVISGQIFPPHATGLQPLTVGQIIDFRGYNHNIQSSSFDGSQSSQQAPIIETGVTMSPDEEEEYDNDSDPHIQTASNIPQPQPRIENITTASTTTTSIFNSNAGCIPSPHPSSTNSIEKTTEKSSSSTEQISPEMLELPNSPNIWNR